MHADGGIAKDGVRRNPLNVRTNSVMFSAYPSARSFTFYAGRSVVVRRDVSRKRDAADDGIRDISIIDGTQRRR